MQTWAETLAFARADSAAVTVTATGTSMLPSDALVNLPGNFLQNPGQTLYLRAFGRCTTTAAASTFSIQPRLGGVTLATLATPTGAATALTNATWWLELFLQLRTGGSAASVMLAGNLTWPPQTGVTGSSTAGPATILLPQTAPAVSATFDARGTVAFDLYGFWSIASQSLTTHAFTLQSLN